MVILDDGGPTQDEANAWVMSELDDIIDLITDKYIRFDLGGGRGNMDSDVYMHHVYLSDMDPYEFIIGDGGGMFDYGSAAEAREALLAEGRAQETGDDQIIIQRHGAAFPGPDVFIKKNGARWNEIRSWFEGISRLYETVLSFQPDGFISPRMRMEFAVDDLVPVGDISDDDVEELSSVDVSNAGDEPAISDDLNNRLTGNDTWADARAADGFLEGWQGRGAQVFKWAYLERRPSILVGQALTAKALHQSTEILEESYRNLRTESQVLMPDVEDVFFLYPAHNPTDSGGWGGILEKVAGVASLVGAGASLVAWHPAGATIGSIARIVGGGATLAHAITESTGYQNEVAKELALDGDSVTELYEDWCAQIQSFIDTVLNTEQVIGENLTALAERIEVSKETDGAKLVTTFGDAVELTEYHSFFAVKGVGDGAFTPGSRDGMGLSTPNGDTGTAFAGDLNELFKAGALHLPAVADVYGRQAGREADEGMAAATQRTVYETSPAGGSSYSTESNGAVLQPWLNLHASYEAMMTTSETNFRTAAELLTTTAIQYRDQDDAAAAGLDEVYQELEEVGTP